MGNLRTGNRRKLRAGRYDPVRCVKHDTPYQGAGFAYAAGLKFAVFECPRPHCKSIKLIHVAGEPMSADDKELF